MIKDPLYGHIIGAAKCQVKDCQGHRQSSGATAHYLVDKYYGGTRVAKRLKKEARVEKKLDATRKAQIRRKKIL